MPPRAEIGQRRLTGSSLPGWNLAKRWYETIGRKCPLLPDIWRFVRRGDSLTMLCLLGRSK